MPELTPEEARQRWPSVELSRLLAPRPQIRHVLFDFDGTLSLIRQGWPEIMVPMFLEMLPPREGETPEEARRLVTDDIMRLTGKQTIYQMMRLAERVRERGGEPREPLWYKHEYLRRLDAHIRGRVAALESGATAPDALLVHAARPLLEHLLHCGLQLHLASGTDEPFVKAEARLLDLDRYFGPRIFGALDDYKKSSKRLIIQRLFQENRVSGAHLLAFGDGYVEIENTVEVGGLAIAVASDEAANGSGRVDDWKRRRLLEVGAHAVIPDFRDAIPLVDALLGR
jgi:phosphoglycolate phosphatase